MNDRLCPCCGTPLDGLSVRAGVPDALIGQPLPPGTDPYEENVIPLRPGECYVRALLEIPLCGTQSMQYCLWLHADDEVVRHAWETWNDDAAYAELSFTARLANRIEPWGLLGAEVTARVTDVSELPHITASADPVLARVLSEPQPYEVAVPARSGR